MLTPSRLDPNYKAEMARKKIDPASFGMGVPLPADERNLTGSGLTADRDKDKKVAKPAPPDEAAKLTEFLDQPVHNITPQIEAMDDAQLAELHAAESAGKARKGLIEAIEDAQLARM